MVEYRIQNIEYRIQNIDVDVEQQQSTQYPFYMKKERQTHDTRLKKKKRKLHGLENFLEAKNNWGKTKSTKKILQHL